MTSLKTNKQNIKMKLSRYLEQKNNNFYNRMMAYDKDKRKYLHAFIRNEPFPPFEIEIQISSSCNLKCRWCIGHSIQEHHKVSCLSNEFDENNIQSLIKGIKEFNIGGLGIDIIKFSGFIGEPLLNKSTLSAISAFSAAGKKVGLFTNGVFMEKTTDKDIYEILSRIDYVHVSLDSGPEKYFWLKEPNKVSYSKETFNKIIENIHNLHKIRIKNKTHLKINVGYVIIPGNESEIYTAAEIVKKAGADSIRFKCDISGKNKLNSDSLKTAFIQFKKAQTLCSKRFTVQAIYSKDDIKNEIYSKWNKSKKCFYQNFLATIGSNGNLYLCDHNTMPSGSPLGNIINESLQNIWISPRRKFFTSGIEYVCESTVCPPFGNCINSFLNEIECLKQQGIDSHDIIKTIDSQK
jgi:MoaA/NifB/PqqE/SkfB family radical SAM enzyme